MEGVEQLKNLDVLGIGQQKLVFLWQTWLIGHIYSTLPPIIDTLASVNTIFHKWMKANGFKWTHIMNQSKESNGFATKTDVDLEITQYVSNDPTVRN